jgi:DNA-binding beta-propeller fold protein YncE
MKKIVFLVVIMLLGCTFQAMAGEPIGIVVNSNTNGFHLIDPLTQELSPSMLKGELGSYGGGLFDVVITPNGKTAIISNFGDSQIHFIDISGGFSAQPTILGVVDIPFFAEDMDITPDGMYVLVTDGGFSSRCAVVDIANMALVSNQNLGSNQAQAVAVSPDGKTVLFADYWNMAIHSYTIDANGLLTFVETYYLDVNRPVNIVISPDGKTAIGVCAVRYDCPIFAIDPATSTLNLKDKLRLPTKSGQSCVFSKDGTKAYYLSSTFNNGPQIHVFNITGPGVVAYDSSIQMSIPRGTSQLFGVDVIAVDPSGNYLYVSNPTLSGGVVEVTVIDLTTNTEMNQLHCLGIPTGIAFGTIE